MKKLILIGCALLITACNSSSNKKSALIDKEVNKNNEPKIVNNEFEKKVSIYFGEDLFTEYLYFEDYYKPVLYPLISTSGKNLTRGYPIDPKPGERVDHPHQVGHWLNYGDVNGLDFWNNSDAIPADKKDEYGTIYHKSVTVDENSKELIAVSEWKAPDGNLLIEETTRFQFSQDGTNRIIDRTSSLKAMDNVDLKDNKEGFLGIRVARALELPSNKAEIFTDANGIASDVKVLNNEGVTGNYLSSEGIEGGAAWGTQARWMTLTGEIENEPVAVTIYDHPENIGYPTYWHARGYGLFAANPLGVEIFTNGESKLNLSLPKGDIITFKYRILLHSGTKQSVEEIESFTKF